MRPHASMLEFVAVLALVAPGLAAPSQVRAQESRPLGVDGPTALERWQRLDEGERAMLRERFQRYMELDEERRRELRRRFARVHVLQQIARGALPEAVRAQLESLGDAERRALLREHYESELAERGRRVRELLPPAWREKLEQADAAERDRLIAALRAERRKRGSERALDELAPRLDLPEAERERIRQLPPEERWTVVLGLRRKALEERLASEGLPQWLTQEQWDALRPLDDRAFLEQLHALRGGGGGAYGRLRELLRPDPAWRLELAQLDPAARRKELGRRVGERVLDCLATRPDLVAPAELERLRGLEGRELHEALRKLLRKDPPPDAARD